MAAVHPLPLYPYHQMLRISFVRPRIIKATSKISVFLVNIMLSLKRFLRIFNKLN